MMYQSRKWRIRQMDNSLDLALLLKQRPWPVDTGFQLGEYLFLNDSLSPFGCQLYSVVHMGKAGPLEVDLIELHWLDLDDLVSLIEAIIDGEFDGARWAESLPGFLMENCRA